ncbi:MAG: hypothetical protein V4681_02895 [Patescibacteria group bacterium]
MLRTIILIVVIVLVLSFFGISIQSVINSPTGQENFGFLWDLIKDGWEVIKEGWNSFLAFFGEIFKPLSFGQ